MCFYTLEHCIHVFLFEDSIDFYVGPEKKEVMVQQEIMNSP